MPQALILPTPQPTAPSWLGIALEQQFLTTSVTLNQTPAVLTVGSTAGYPSAGTIHVAQSLFSAFQTGGRVPVTYTGTTPNSFTGCTIPSGSLALTASVSIIGWEGIDPRSPTAFIPIKKREGLPNLRYMSFGGNRGSRSEEFGEDRGVRSADYTIAGDVHLDTVPFWIAQVLSGVAVTGTGPYTYKLTMDSTGNGQPTPLTLIDVNKVANWQYPGARIAEVSFHWDETGRFEYDARLITWFGQTVAVTPPSTWSKEGPTPSWRCVATVNGVPDVRLYSGDITFTNVNAKPCYTHVGAQDPWTTWAGGLIKVEGNVDWIMGDLTEFNYYNTNSEPSLTLDFTNPSTQGLEHLTIHGSQVAFVNGNWERGRTHMEMRSHMRFVANATDTGPSGGLSPAVVTVVNNVPPTAPSVPTYQAA